MQRSPNGCVVVHQTVDKHDKEIPFNLRKVDLVSTKVGGHDGTGARTIGAGYNEGDFHRWQPFSASLSPCLVKVVPFCLS